MHETQCYEVGEVADEVKDEEKQIDVTGVEVALDDRRPEQPAAVAPPPPPPLDEPAPVDEPAATPFDEETTPQTIDEPPNPFDKPFDEPTTPTTTAPIPPNPFAAEDAGAAPALFDEPTTPTGATIPQLTEVPTPCRRDSEIARELHEADAARARELDEARRRDEELAARLAADDERERDAARKRDEELAAQLLEDDEREARAAAAQRELDDAAAAARLASEMADAERALEMRAESDALVARRLAGEVPLRRGSSDEAYARAVALALEDEDEEDEARTRDDALLARALQHEEAHDAERAPRRRGDADLDLALAMTLDEEEAARRDAYEAAGSDDEALARALQSQEDDRHQAFAFDDEALARRLEEEANLECVRRLAARDERDDARLAFELERQQHEAMKRAEDDFSVAARVQRELTAREEDEKAAARRRELEPPSRLTRPAEAPVKENRKQRRERMLLEEAREIEKRAAMSLGRDPSLDELADQAARDQAAGAATTSRTSAAHAIAAQSGGDVFGNIDYALGRAADAERLAADRTYDQRRELLARASHRPDDSNRLRAAALRDRAHKQGDRAAGLYFAANNGHILDEARDVERARNLGLEGVLNEALTNLHAAFSNGERVQVDLHWLTRRDATFVVDEVLDVLQRAEWRNDPDLFFQVGQGRHSAGGRPVLHGAVCDCLEKDMRSSLRAREGLDHVHVWHRRGRDRYPSSPRAG